MQRLQIANKSEVIRSIVRLCFCAYAFFLAGFALSFFFEPLGIVGSSILNALMLELSPLLGTLAYGFVVATLSLFAWNFLMGAGLQIIAGLFGAEAPRIVLFGRAVVIGFIYGATTKSIAHALNYDLTNLTILVIVLLTEFLAYSIAAHEGIRVGKSVGKIENGTRGQKIVNFLIGPLPFTYKQVKPELKKTMKSTLKLGPIIVALLLFAAILEIWLIIG